MSCLKAILKSDASSVRDIKINDYVNMVIQEIRKSTDAFAKLEMLYFLAKYVYLKFVKIDKAKKCLDDIMKTKLLKFVEQN